MKKLAIAFALAVGALFAAQLYAAESAAPKLVKPDWHYRWHEGRWWYWIPETSKWMVWSGSIWVPFEKVATCNCMQPVSQTTFETAATESTRGTESATVTPEPSYSGGGGYQPGYSSGAGSDSAGYGWSWGPGTAFRDSPGRRF